MDATTAVYFRRQDYAGFWLRLLIDFVDSVVIGIACLMVMLALWGVAGGRTILLTWAAISFCYFVLLKRSKVGTAGYLVGGVKIVGPDGQRASSFSLTPRFTFMILGPLNSLLDLVWLSGDAHRQALRDKLAQTYVVRRKAEPVGTARLLPKHYEICGMNFLFREIEPVPGAAEAVPRIPTGASQKH